MPETSAKTDFVRQLDQSIATDLRRLWGGRLPSWEEFRQASRGRNVKVNKGIAAQAIFLTGVPKAHMIMFGVITAGSAFLLPGLAAIAYFMSYISGWWVIGSMLAGWYLYKVTLEGAADGIRYGAEQHEGLYLTLASSGAFLFDPSREA